MPQMGELDKMLIQDLLDRRKKHSDSIVDSFRLLAIVIAAGVGFYVGQIGNKDWERKVTPAMKPDLFLTTGIAFFLGALLSFGFVWWNGYHFVLLQRGGEELKRRLYPWREQVNDATELKMGQRIIVLGAALTISMLVGAGFFFLASHVAGTRLPVKGS